MELETTLSQTIRTAGSNSDYDSACKRLLSEKIIEKYIEGEPQVAEVPVLPDQTNPSLIKGERTEDKTITEGTITYDIRFTATAPKSGEFIRLIINVEAQNNFYPDYFAILHKKIGLSFTYEVYKVYSVPFVDSF